MRGSRHLVAVRDSKNPSGPALAFQPPSGADTLAEEFAGTTVVRLSP
ncbi:DUF397 domain-containing protein [Streptosporangium saharense]